MVDKIQNNPFNRPPRIQDKFKPEEIDIPSPPLKPEETARNVLLMLLPMGSFLVMGLFYALIFSVSSTGNGWLYAIPMLGMALFTFLASFMTYGEQKHEQKQRWIKQQRDYHRLLDKKESRLVSGQFLQRTLLLRRFPSPSQLLMRVKNLQIDLWERRVEDVDFLTFRLGEGKVPSAIPIKRPDPDHASTDIRRAYGIYAKYNTLPAAPVTIDLRELGSLALVGNRDNILPMSRALLVQLATLNSPDDVSLYVFSSQSQYRTWKWLRWLPHTSEENVGGHPTFMAFTRRSNKRLITKVSKNLDAAQQSQKENPAAFAQVSAPAIVALFDDEIDVRDEQVFHEILKNGHALGIFSIVICDRLEDVPSNCQAIIEFSKQGMFQYSKSGAEGIKLEGTPDNVGLVEAENLAHRLLPVAIRTLGKSSRIPTRMNFLQTYEVNHIEDLNIHDYWRRLPAKGGLLPHPVRIGNETYAIPLMINLAENNDGPHGMIAGTTGSGKSELLQTLICALAVEHHPYFVNFLLIDFKGESTFGIFKNLPHVVGLVSNLDKLSALRALEAIKAENVRRQIFLKDQQVEDIGEYHARLNGAEKLSMSWTPLPHLFIIVDEFAQLAHNMPTFLRELVTIGQVGRSLGIHLILATQRPGGIVTDEMRTNLSFRISLRVQTMDDSRDMLLRPDAAFLPPNMPGRAYFQLGDGGTPRQFQVSRAGVVYEPENQRNDRKEVELYKLEYEEPTLVENPQDPLVTEPQNLQGAAADNKDLEKPSVTIASALSSHLGRIYGEFMALGFSSMGQILLPPLPGEIDAARLLAPVSNWNGEQWLNRVEIEDQFNAQVGQRDDLPNCQQPLFTLDFLNYGGHVMAVGGPQSGKTNFLKTLAYALVTKYKPSEVNLYALSFAGRELEILQSIPHVGAVIQGNQSERLHRLIRFLQTEIEARYKDFGKYQVSDLVEYNKQTSEKKAFLVVLIDNFGELRSTEFVDELADMEKLIQKGRTCGIHFVITAMQANDVPYKISNLIQQRIAFNLADHTEYFLLVGRPDSLEFDALPPGRCFVNGTTPPMQCQIALAPNKNEWEKLANHLKMILPEDGKVPVQIEVLEHLIYQSKLQEQQRHKTVGDDFIIGVDGDTLKPFRMNWSEYGAHLLIGGPSQSGRTSLLHTFTLSLASLRSPDDLWIVLVDGANGSLKQLEKLPHVISWINEEDGLTSNIAHLQKELSYRRSLLVDGENQRHAEILFVMDDYDLTCEALALNDVILTKLGKLIRQDTNLNFHFLIAGLSDNLSRDPLIRQLKLARSGVSLVNTDTFEFLGGRPTAAMRSQELPSGRGYLLSRSGYKMIQFAIPDNHHYVSGLWKGTSKAAWRRMASAEEIQQVRDESAPALGASYASTASPRIGSLIDIERSVQMYTQQQQRVKKGMEN